MACLQTNIINKMYNNNNSDHPRISFSNDFAESLHSRPQILKTTSRDYNTPPVSSDFEFSVSGNNMTMTADELFFKGRLLPFKNNNNAGSVVGQKTTLRDELLAGEDDDDGGGGGGVSSSRPPKASSTRWKGFLGLRKSHIGSKRSDKGDGSRSSGSGQDDVHVSKTSQEMINQGGTSNCRDMESRMQ